MWTECRPAFKRPKTWARARRLLFGGLTCLDGKRITDMLCATGDQFKDWTAAYRLFSQQRIDLPEIFKVIRKEAQKSAEGTSLPIVISMDDTLLKKTGRKIHGASWRRDPMGPPFQVNLIRAQRFLQASVAPAGEISARGTRMIPVDFKHVPSPPKLPKDATAEQKKAHRLEQKQTGLCAIAVKRMAELRASFDQLGHQDRPLWLTVDGGYTNATVLKKLPERCVLIGRLRKDADLYYKPEAKAQTDTRRGRHTVYGLPAPTPEELRTDEATPWEQITVFAAGRQHSLRIKTLTPVRSRLCGEKDLRIIVIAPLGYRLSKKGKLLYRAPAFLLCTDVHLPIEQVVQAYFWRWEIEVNHRDEKQLFGVGDAQVRNPHSCESVPAMLVAGYALSLLATQKANQGVLSVIPPPRWNKGTPERISTARILQTIRGELWAKELGYLNFSDFEIEVAKKSKPEKLPPSLASTLFYGVSA